MSRICKVVLSVGYTEYVLDLKDAVTITEILADAEIHKSEYKDGKSFHSIEPQSTRNSVTLRMLSTTEYKMLKLAGEHAGESE